MREEKKFHFSTKANGQILSPKEFHFKDLKDILAEEKLSQLKSEDSRRKREQWLMSALWMKKRHWN